VAEYEKKVRAVLKENACYFVRRGKGSHDIWFSPVAGTMLPVPTKIPSRHTANAIMKEAGIDCHF
jgi:predicted RNA binding protein YcfA (HicA-like mRNA interferase family)